MATTEIPFTINDALVWLKTLRGRHAELVALRDKNAEKETRYYGAQADKQVEKAPVYNVRKLDALVTQVAKEIRLVDTAIKRANSTTAIVGYTQDDDVLGNIEEA